jgi:hypothetical protein
VDLVQEEDRPLTVRAEALTCTGDHLAHLGHGRRHRRQLLEVGPGRVRDHARECRLAASRRPVEDRRAHAVLGDREAERRLLAEDLLLTNDVLEPPRSHAEG